MAFPALAASCGSSPSSTLAEHLGVAQQALFAVGVTCDASAQCATFSECWNLGTKSECHCKAGYVACQGACVAIGGDDANCGWCGNACIGNHCVGGICGGTLPSGGYMVTMSNQFDVSAQSSFSGGHWAHEGDMEFSLNAGILFGLNNYAESSDAGGRDVNFIWADAGTSAWDTTIYHITSSAGYPRVDPTATTSGYSQLEYIGMLLNASPFSCIGAMANYTNGLANQPVCANTHASLEGWDAPDLQYDLAGTTLWAAANQPSGSSPSIYVYKQDDCTGTIGSPTCPTPFSSVLPTTVVSPSHRVAVNRCAPGAFISLRDPSAGTVTLKQVIPGSSSVDCKLVTGEHFSENDNCFVTGGGSYSCGDADQSGTICHCASTSSDCTGNGTNTSSKCWRLLPNVDLALRATPQILSIPATCTLYAAWDSSGTNTAGATRMHARIKVIDVTNGLTVDGSGNCTNTVYYDDTAEFQSFHSTVEVSETRPAFGWFYEKDRNLSNNDDHCATYFWGRVDINYDFSTETIVQISSSSYPNITSALAGTSGDWVQKPHLGVPGMLYPTFAQPISGLFQHARPRPRRQRPSSILDRTCRRGRRCGRTSVERPPRHLARGRRKRRLVRRFR